MVLCVVNRWSDKSFTSLLQVVQDMLPKENTLPKSYYQVKKILCLMGMKYQKIHACPNDCILYRHEFEEMQTCPRCDGKQLVMQSSQGGDPSPESWLGDSRMIGSGMQEKVLEFL